MYDIARHYEYEKGRGVAFLSTMERAIGGKSFFEDQSPLQKFISESQEARRRSKKPLEAFKGNRQAA